MSATQTSTEPVKLHRNLSVWEAIGISLALMAPSMAASINPQGTASLIGRAVPLAFAIAFVGVLLVAYTFVRLTQRFHHSGSVYGFVGATLGPRAGVIAGWALTGTYTFFAVVTAMAGGRFAAGFLDSTRRLEAPAGVGRVPARRGRAAAGLVARGHARPRRHPGAARGRGHHRAADRDRHRDCVRQARSGTPDRES